MNKRNFTNFFDAYLDYANDDFVPSQFNEWTCMSLIAGALERKVWLPWNDTFSYYPNIFVMLISLPGAGKSTALNKGVGLLQDLHDRTNTFNLLPSQATEAKFIELMGQASPFEIGTRHYIQSAGYYFASEASNSLKNIYGDFIACLTDFYDCPPFWEKATQKGGRITLKNVCLNLLAGSTFDYLSKLVTDDNIMGGFASRIIYVVHREKLVRTGKFQSGGGTASSNPARADYRKALVEDLVKIHNMKGSFTASPEFGAAWEAWFPAFEDERQSNPSEKLQSLLVRTNTNVLKLSMAMSAAESDDRILQLRHWERALAMITATSKEIPSIFRQSKALDTKSQSGLNQAIFLMFEKQPNLNLDRLQSELVFKGFNTHMVENTVRRMKSSNEFKEMLVSAKDGATVQLLTDTDRHL